jgi:Phage integrase family
MRGGVAPAFAETDPSSGDSGDIVLSEWAKPPIRYHPHTGSVGRRGAALRRPSPVLGTSAFVAPGQPRRGSASRGYVLLLRASWSGILVTPHQLRRMTMEMQKQVMSSTPRREPWNKGKLIGQKPPLRPKHVWSIRTRLQMDGRTRDLAMFNLAIDSKLRGCDVVALRVEDVAPSGYAVDRATVRQKKTGRPVRFELTEQTRQAVDDYIKAAGKKPGEYLFSGGAAHDRCMTTRQYARLVSSWVATIGLDPQFFGTHSLRRTKATLIYRRTGNLRAVQLLFGHTAYCPRTPDGSQGPLPLPSAIR